MSRLDALAIVADTYAHKRAVKYISTKGQITSPVALSAQLTNKSLMISMELSTFQHLDEAPPPKLCPDADDISKAIFEGGPQEPSALAQATK